MEAGPAELLEIVSKVAATRHVREQTRSKKSSWAVPDADSRRHQTNYDRRDECLKQAKSMKVGTWVEFSDAETGTKERAKLSWISPISSKYLFVNRKGLKVSDKTVFALAAEMRRGASARDLEEVPLFDRALDAIVERLKAAAPLTANGPPKPA